MSPSRRPPGRFRRPRWVAPLATAGAVAVVLGYVGVVNPATSGHYPTCPLYQHTGLLCPGCGGLRCLHALAHGDLPAALRANLPLVLVAAVGVVLWGRWLWRALWPAHPASRPWSSRWSVCWSWRWPRWLAGCRGPCRRPPGGRGAGRPASTVGRSRWPALPWLLGGVLLGVFTLLRNLPVGPFATLLAP